MIEGEEKMSVSITERSSTAKGAGLIISCKRGFTSINHEVSNALRCLRANDVCILGARDCHSAALEASVQRWSVHVRQTGSVRRRVVKSPNPPIYSGWLGTTGMQPCAEIMRQLIDWHVTLGTT